jgi:methionine aminopeptidase
MIFLKTDEEIELLRESNDLLGRTLAEVAKELKPGVTTAQLDTLAEQFIRDNGGIPSCKGFEGYPATLCTSVNEQVVHGIPSEKTVLRDGDIISVDLCVLKNGFHADSAYTFPVGEVSDEVMAFLVFVVKKNRSINLQGIADSFVEQYRVAKGIVLSDLVTHQPIDDEARRTVTRLVEEYTGKQCELHDRTDPKMLGGFKLEFDHNMYDARIRTKIRKLRLEFAKNDYESKL